MGFNLSGLPPSAKRLRRLAARQASFGLLLVAVISPGLLDAAKAHPDHHQPSNHQQQSAHAAEQSHGH